MFVPSCNARTTPSDQGHSEESDKDQQQMKVKFPQSRAAFVRSSRVIRILISGRPSGCCCCSKEKVD